jgi:hypothetical protein
MVRTSRSTNQHLETLMGDVSEYGARNAENITGLGDAGHDPPKSSRMAGIGAGLATLVSIIALLFSGFSFYETVLKQASLRFYQPPLMYLYRENFRDVFAIPVTISNDGAQRGTILSFDLTIEHRTTGAKMQFQNLHFGASPKGTDKRLFVPITVAGRSSFSDVVLFHALDTGSFVETTGGVELPLRLTLKMNVDKSSEWGPWFAQKPPPPVTFDMTASYIAGMRDMESGRPTQLHDMRWSNARRKQ